MPASQGASGAAAVAPPSTATATATVSAAPQCAPREQFRIDFPPVKDKEEVLKEQQAAVPQEEIRHGMETDIPPVIRSVLELSHLMMSGHSHWLRAAPGYEGGLFYKGKPFCFASGYRDGTRPQDMDDKGNHMKLKDPLIYGTLSLPIASAYLCELHSKGRFDIDAPLIAYLPELHTKGLGADVTARSILSFSTVIDDAQVLKDAGANLWKPALAMNICAATQRYVYDPLNRFLAAGSGARLSGLEQRRNLVQYVRTSPRLAGFRRVALPKAHISHFSIALLIAAVETQLKGRSFEEDIHDTFFVPAQSHGAGYGPPKLWRDPNELFYQPTGLALQHQRFRQPVAAGAPENAAPPVLNASLNLYAPAEDFGKLLMLSLDTILNARDALADPHYAACAAPHFDFGVQHVPSAQLIQLKQKLFYGLDMLPASSSFRYNTDYDLGCFGIASCGSRGGRLFGDTLSRMIQHLFVKHVIGKGVDAEAQVDLDHPDQPQSDTEEKFQKIMKDQEYKNYFKGHDAHKRF